MTPEEQARLTSVGRGTPVGELLRRYWFPVAVAHEVAPGTAVPVRLLGEDLALFRRPDGALGLLPARCPHRGASLAHGFVDGAGLACPYHGWRFATDGRCVGMPGEPDERRRLARGDVAPYRAEELGGLVFAYLGPAPVPLLPRYDLYVWDGVARDVGRAVLPCNWLQIMENSVDPLHVEALHGHHLGAVRRAAGQPEPTHYRRRHVRIGFDRFELGIVKRRVLEGGSEDDDDWRVGHPLVFPVTLRVGAAGQHRFQVRVPVDDTTTLHWWYGVYRPDDPAALPADPRPATYEVPWRTPDGGFRTDFVDGGDIMTWVTQGPVADRTQERLVASDEGIALLRRMVLEEAARVARGEDPLGVVRDPARNGCIDLPQERDKYRGGRGFLREAVELSHVRFSPLAPWILAHVAGGADPRGA